MVQNWLCTKCFEKQVEFLNNKDYFQLFILIDMGKNENIIAQDLCEIKHAIQTQDITKINEQCEILGREILKYSVKPNIIDKLKDISNYSESSSLSKSSEEQIKEINDLVDILTSK